MQAILSLMTFLFLSIGIQLSLKNDKHNMVYVEGGVFDMGNPIEHHYFYRKEKPVHSVRLKDFYIEKFEVTNSDYVEFLNSNAKGFKVDTTDRASKSSVGIRYYEDIYLDVKVIPDSTFYSGLMLTEIDNEIKFKVINGFENFPVTFVTWYGAKAYCKWKYKNGDLPSESQWEYAARNGKYWMEFNFKYSGGNVLDSVGWYWDNSRLKPHEVGQKLANKLGLYDMSGNLWEWTNDHWHDNYQNAPKDGSAWIESEFKKDHNRVLRGGAWLYSSGEAATTNRWNDVPDDRHDYKGFRCVCEN